MADPIWLSCCYEISIELVVVYIFIRAKKDMKTEKNDGMKNSKGKKGIKCEEMAFWRGSNKFVYL